MKRNIIFSVIAIILMATSCNQKVSLGENVYVPFEQSDLAPDEPIVYTVSKALQFDPVNLGGIDIAKHMDIFDDVTFTIYRENAKVVAAEFAGNMPFKVIEPFEGKQEAYFDTERMPQAIRLKSNDQIVAVYSVGEFYMPFQLGCQEVRYELRFK